MQYKVDISGLSNDVSLKIWDEVGKGKTREQIYNEIGVARPTIRSIKKRENGYRIRMDAFLIITSWLGADPGKYFI